MRYPAAIVTASLFAFAALEANAQSSCGLYDFSGPYVAAWTAGEPFAGARDAAEKIRTMADGRCHQDRVIEALEEPLGGRAGYKAAATSAGARQQLGLDAPVLGVLFNDMILNDGARVDVDRGAAMIFELDLLARVGDEAINEATTREEALASIDAFVPFIELGDLMMPRGARVTGPLLQAMNAGARLGVAGEPVAVEPSTATVEALGTMKGTLVSQNGTVLAEAEGSALLGHPLDAALFIVEAARKRGWRLRGGDILSLGSLGRFQPAQPGMKIDAIYEGLATKPVRVSVTLR